MPQNSFSLALWRTREKIPHRLKWGDYRDASEPVNNLKAVSVFAVI